MGFTDLFRLRYMDPDTPLRQLDTVTKDMAETIEAALRNVGAVPAGYADAIAALAARTTATELQNTAPVLRRRVTSNFVLPYAQFTLVPWGRAGFDSLGNQWTSATPDRLLCRRAGYYQVNAGLGIALARNGRQFIEPRVNGNAIFAGAGNGADSVAENGVQTSFLWPMNVGDYLTFAAWQDATTPAADGKLLNDSTYSSTWVDWQWRRPL